MTALVPGDIIIYRLRSRPITPPRQVPSSVLKRSKHRWL